MNTELRNMLTRFSIRCSAYASQLFILKVKG
jgi:hypothetical protein